MLDQVLRLKYEAILSKIDNKFKFMIYEFFKFLSFYCICIVYCPILLQGYVLVLINGVDVKKTAISGISL